GPAGPAGRRIPARLLIFLELRLGLVLIQLVVLLVELCLVLGHVVRTEEPAVLQDPAGVGGLFKITKRVCGGRRPSAGGPFRPTVSFWTCEALSNGRLNDRCRDVGRCRRLLFGPPRRRRTTFGCP